MSSQCRVIVESLSRTAAFWSGRLGLHVRQSEGEAREARRHRERESSVACRWWSQTQSLLATQRAEPLLQSVTQHPCSLQHVPARSCPHVKSVCVGMCACIEALNGHGAKNNGTALWKAKHAKMKESAGLSRGPELWSDTHSLLGVSQFVRTHA